MPEQHPKHTPSQRAVALKYSQYQSKSNLAGKKDAPKITAKGTHEVAQKIIDLAQEHGVLIHKDDELSEVLAQLDLGQEIPEALYHVIAELIAFSYVLQGKFPDHWDNMHELIDFKE